MFDNLTLRNTFLAVAAIPASVLILAAFWATAIDRPVLAVWAGLGAIATMTVGHLAGQRITERLSALETAVAKLTDEELPAIVATINDPDSVVDVTTSTEVDDTAPGADQEGELPALPEDELTTLTRSVAGIGTKARDLLAEQEETTNRRLAELVKNLARRHQSLLSHQIEHIDWLEDTEQSPPRLEQLFKLDHLATRLRRSAETVLVLAGGESTRPRGGPAPIATVLRVAMGETEAYTKIKLRTIEDVLIAGGPAFDLVHLLAELLENATQFSPPETPVELHAVRREDRSYQITIIDRGVGMDDDRMEAANELVSNPPEINLAIGRSIGFIVVGRLADRLGASVDIAQTPGSGVTATIVVPATVVLDAPAPTALAPPPPATAPRSDRAEPTPAPSSSPSPARDRTTPEPDDEPEPTSRSGSAPERPRVTEDSSNALAKLLGISDDIADLEESSRWSAPSVGGGKANPLKSRATPPPVPPSLAGSAGTAGDTPDKTSDQPTGDETAEDDEAPTRPKRASRARRSKPRPSKRRSRPVRTLDEALPSGVAFDSGVEGLLAEPDETTGARSRPSIEDLRPSEEATSPDTTDATDQAPSRSTTPEEATTSEETWVPPTVSESADSKLTRREKGASAVPSSKGPRVKASSRKPEEIRSMITRYRDGLKGSDGDTDDGDTDDGDTGDRPSASGDPAPAGDDSQAEKTERPSPESGKEG
jgi:signal transduction histidine kinase